MSPDRLRARNTFARRSPAEVRGRADSVAEVLMVDSLAQALRDRLEVAPGKAAVGGEAFGQNEQRPALCGRRAVVPREPATNVREWVLLGAHRHPIGERRELAHDLGHRPIALARL